MKLTLIITVDIDLPEDVTREDIQRSMDETTNIWLDHIDRTVPATVTAVDYKEPHE